MEERANPIIETKIKEVYEIFSSGKDQFKYALICKNDQYVRE